DSCLEWKADTDCAANGQICDATQGDPQCIACTTDCDPATYTPSCTAQGEPVNCTLHGTNCWTADTGPACGSNEACEVHDGVAECVPTCTEGLTDGSFENVDSTGTWTATSTAYGSPMCDPSSCGSGNNYAFDGTWWVWMGGTQSGGDEAHVSQDFTIPAGRQATLYFLLWMPAVSGSPGEFVEVLVDDTQVWTADTSAVEYQEFYTLVSVDMSSYADGQSHTLDFHGVIVGPGTSIFIDYAGLGIGAYTTSSCCWNGCPAADLNYCGTDATGGNAAKYCVEQSNGCLDWDVQTCTAPTDYCDDSTGTAQCTNPPTCNAIDLGTFDGTTTITQTAQDSCTNGSTQYSGAGCTDTGWASAGNEIVYKVTVPDGVTMNVSMTSTGGGFDEYLWVTTDCLDFDSAQCIAAADDTMATGETLSVTNNSGGDLIYYIVADGYGSGTCGTFDLALSP
ncbi:MAG: hypothetical protein D6806_07330, partial [Deltaproteobacteria bacterium]